MKAKFFDGKIYMIVDIAEYAKVRNMEKSSIKEVIDSIIKEANLNGANCEVTAVPITKGGAA